MGEVTPEMIEAALAKTEEVGLGSNADYFGGIYLAMKALDPEVERLREALAQACELISEYPHEWAALATPRYAQPCNAHEYIEANCLDCGKFA